ncbi:hypothetical protein CPAR01_04821, partial [Colletotrichum paranaense]
ALSCHGYGNFIIAPCSQRLQKPIEHQVSSQSSYPQIELRTQSCTSGSAVMRSSLRQSDRVVGSKFSDCCEALRMAGPDPSPCCIASTAKHLQKESWHITVGGNAACSDMAYGSLDGKDQCETSTSSSGLSKLGDTFESCNDHPATVPVDSTSMYGARISEARQMFESTLTTLLNPKRVISKCTITRRA